MNETTNVLDEAVKLKWYKIVFQLKKQFGKKPDMNGILFLIGMQELGQVRTFTKDEKVDLFHIATCKLLSYFGYYVFEYKDAEGWPHYTLVQKPPFTDLLNQENLLKQAIVKYYDEHNLYED